MARDVFITYSSKDTEIAESLRSTLEAHGIRCWMAPRDITPGRSYSDGIIEAINGCRVMVLVYSEHSNRSGHVLREVERGISKGIPVIPFRISNAPLSPGMEYFISTCHWLDALEPPLERHFLRLTEAVRRRLGKANLRRPPIAARSGPRPTEEALATKPGGWLLPIGVGTSILLLAGVVALLLRPSGPGSSFGSGGPDPATRIGATQARAEPTTRGGTAPAQTAGGPGAGESVGANQSAQIIPPKGRDTEVSDQDGDQPAKQETGKDAHPSPLGDPERSQAVADEASKTGHSVHEETPTSPGVEVAAIRAPAEERKARAIMIAVPAEVVVVPTVPGPAPSPSRDEEMPMRTGADDRVMPALFSTPPAPRPKPVVPPTVRLLKPTSGNVVVVSGIIVEVQATPQDDEPVSDLVIFLNDVPVIGPSLESRRGPGTATWTERRRVGLQPGRNRIRIVARNRIISSDPLEIEVTYTPPMFPRGLNAPPRLQAAYLGLRPSLRRSSTTSLTLGSPSPGSPAYHAIKPGDVLRRIDGQVINSQAEYRTLLRRYQPGQTVTVDVLRAGIPTTFVLTFAAGTEE